MRDHKRKSGSDPRHITKDEIGSPLKPKKQKPNQKYKSQPKRKKKTPNGGYDMHGITSGIGPIPLFCVSTCQSSGVPGSI